MASRSIKLQPLIYVILVIITCQIALPAQPITSVMIAIKPIFSTQLQMLPAFPVPSIA